MLGGIFERAFSLLPFRPFSQKGAWSERRRKVKDNGHERKEEDEERCRDGRGRTG